MKYKYIDLGSMGIGFLLMVIGTPILKAIGIIIVLFGFGLSVKDGILSKGANSPLSENRNQIQSENINDQSLNRNNTQAVSKSNSNTNYWLIALVGVLILGVGLTMPATETVASESCTDGFSWGDSRVGGGCVEAQAEVPNTTRTPTLLLGAVLLLFGGAMSVSKSNDPAKNGNNAKRTDNMDKLYNRNDRSDTDIKISAKTLQPKTNESAVSELIIETSDINEAKEQFRMHCEKNNLKIISNLDIDVVE